MSFHLQKDLSVFLDSLLSPFIGTYILKITFRIFGILYFRQLTFFFWGDYIPQPHNCRVPTHSQSSSFHVLYCTTHLLVVLVAKIRFTAGTIPSSTILRPLLLHPAVSLDRGQVESNPPHLTWEKYPNCPFNMCLSVCASQLPSNGKSLSFFCWLGFSKDVRWKDTVVKTRWCLIVQDYTTVIKGL